MRRTRTRSSSNTTETAFGFTLAASWAALEARGRASRNSIRPRMERTVTRRDKCVRDDCWRPAREDFSGGTLQRGEKSRSRFLAALGMTGLGGAVGEGRNEHRGSEG